MDYKNSTLAEVAATNTSAQEVLLKYGIDFCCDGHRNFETACREIGVTPQSIEEEILANQEAKEDRAELERGKAIRGL